MRRRTKWWIAAVLFAGCAGSPITPEQRRLAELRLLAPFRQATEVGCGELQVEMTGNFYGNVGRPAVDKAVHHETVTKGDGYVETAWTNLTGQAASAFSVTIGEPPEITETGMSRPPRMTFTVVNELRIRVYSDVHVLTLSAVASGDVVMIKEASGKAREVQGVTIADGVMHTP